MDVAAIIYRSLYPFDFHNNRSDAFRALLSTWNTSSSRGDLIANVVLYLPFGFFAVRSLRNQSSLRRILVVFACGATLSAAMELMQFYDAGRQSAMSDVYANTAGALLGSLAGAGLSRELTLGAIGKWNRRPFVVMLLSCWLAYRLFPLRSSD